MRCAACNSEILDDHGYTRLIGIPAAEFGVRHLKESYELSYCHLCAIDMKGYIFHKTYKKKVNK